MAASRLFELSVILKVPVQYFFDDESGNSISFAALEPPEGESEDAYRLRQFMNTPECHKLCDSFLRVGLSSQRRLVLNLMQTMDGGQRNGETATALLTDGSD
jgi:hypothetical protein